MPHLKILTSIQVANINLSRHLFCRIEENVFIHQFSNFSRFLLKLFYSSNAYLKSVRSRISILTEPVLENFQSTFALVLPQTVSVLEVLAAARAFNFFLYA